MQVSGGWLIGVAAGAFAMLASCLEASAGSSLVTPWVSGHSYQVRLIAGGAARGTGAPRTYAAVEVRMSQGWKTYWRMPGDAGGMPPRFDWSGSVNLASANVLYPAPKRLRDAVGDAVGYSGSVLFPVDIHAKDETKPVELKLVLEFGVCREICIPAEATLSLPIPPDLAARSEPIDSALALVPRDPASRLSNDPELKQVQAHLDGDKPRLVIEAAFPASSATADLFVEAPDAIYLPVPVKVGESAGRARFEVDLSQNSEPPDLKGKALTITMTSEAGQSEATWIVK